MTGIHTAFTLTDHTGRAAFRDAAGRTVKQLEFDVPEDNDLAEYHALYRAVLDTSAVFAELPDRPQTLHLYSDLDVIERLRDLSRGPERSGLDAYDMLRLRYWCPVVRSLLAFWPDRVVLYRREKGFLNGNGS